MSLSFEKQRDKCLHNAGGKITRQFFLICLFPALSVPASIFAAPVPVAGDAPVAVERLRPDNPAVLPMTGTWRFKLNTAPAPPSGVNFPPTLRCPTSSPPLPGR